MTELAASVQRLVVTLPPEHTYWGLTIEQWTLIVAVATLVAVGVQIYLAGRELGYVAQDLKNNTEQFKDFMRRPRINFNQWVVWQPVGGQSHVRSGTMNYELWNDGDRLSVDGMLEVLVPNDALATPLPEASTSRRVVDGIPYSVTARFYNARLYPNSVRYQTGPISLALKDSVGEVTILWRIYDDFGKHPKGEYGKCELRPQ